MHILSYLVILLHSEFLSKEKKSVGIEEKGKSCSYAESKNKFLTYIDRKNRLQIIINFQNVVLIK